MTVLSSGCSRWRSSSSSRASSSRETRVKARSGFTSVQDVNETMADIRSLASGLYPSVLVERGLVEALSETAAACPLPTTLSTHDVGRYAPEIEGAVYFCCREALQNAAKHAAGATAAEIRLWEEGAAVHFEVRDDGAGFSPTPAARGRG